MLSEVRSQCGHKWCPCPIRMRRTQVPKLAQQDLKCVCTEVRSRCGHLWRPSPSPLTKAETIFFLLNAPLSSAIASILLYATTDRRFTKMSRGDAQLSHRDLHFSRVKIKGGPCFMLSEVRSKMAFFWHLYPMQNADMEASR